MTSNSRVAAAAQSVKKPHIVPFGNGFWLCEGGNLGGTGNTPSGAYRVWKWNMLRNARPVHLWDYGLPTAK